ncbi:SusD/RagB family nutrient-binding outer membrane lipoprotein [Tamlana sp. 2201CG12-4]|uniref:SusD/RagB family nutrient-binding outer membrane lipoprotein n=1 Tax=Tamlana sp. 2201CG12-4 TaxID=3112582 RepID=UPI002DBD7E0A|nr:SusD/RagB family nutrient-binding outer membrane lipoprotein [Tamlana sp. 2201CG12-4]MEC3906678.1 SusD/RagB family nutrient-binding outer membrane lipoprotein [Tamlana sp. 2201CG12-4]
MKNKIYALLVLFGLLLAGCDKGFEELNESPDRPVTADLSAVYNKISNSFRNIGTEQTFLRNELLLPSTQLTGLSRRIGVDPISRTQGSLWENYYKALKNIVFLEREIAASEGLNTFSAEAMLKIAKAFLTLKITDLYGDIPFTEAAHGFVVGEDQVLRPVYDDSKSIYLACLEDLKWASDNINTTGDGTLLSFAGVDSYYGGDLLKWEKLANTLRLRYALRISEKEAAIADEIISEILGGGKPVIEGTSSTSEDFYYNRISADDRSWLQPAFRAAGSNGVRLGENIWNFMSDSDAQDGSGIFDPRLYIYFEPNKDDLWIPVTQDFDAVDPVDDADIYHGSRANDYHNERHLNHYAAINTNFVFSRTNRVPVVTSSEAYFLKAEAYARGIGVAKDMTLAEENYYNGIRASVNYWYEVVDDLEKWQYPITISMPPTETEMNNFLSHAQVAFTGTDDEKLNKIYGQRWASLFWLPEEAHFLQSRTERTPLIGSRGDFYRMPYPETEEANNKQNFDAAVTKMGGNGFDIKLWWMK